MKGGKANGTIPPNAGDTPMGYIMDFAEDSFVIRRMNFADEFMPCGREEKPGERWSFPLPYVNDKRYSFQNRIKKNVPPVITETIGTAEIANDKVILTFSAAKDDDFVHSYKVVTDGRDEKLFFSDFYNGIDVMKNTVRLELNVENPHHAHEFCIYAVDSWGAISDNYIVIKSDKGDV